MESIYRFWPWFQENWSRAGLITAAILIAFSPFLRGGMSLATFLVFLHLPLYMLHQYEEHSHGAFKAYVNHEIGHGKEILNDASIFWINVGEVWLVDLAVIYLAALVNPSLGAIAIYLTIVNGLLHIVFALLKRRYNPGLWTSLVLFLPVGGFTLYLLGTATHLTTMDHLLGIGAAVLLHLSLVIPVQLSRRHTEAAQLG